MARSILDRWDCTEDQLTQLIDSNPSLRGMIQGYLAELKFRDLWLSREGFSGVAKPDDHDRRRAGDWVARYKGRRFVFEVKSLQTKTVTRTLDGWVGKAQVDASDRRAVVLPDGSKLDTTCLRRGDFDILAVSLFAFTGKWNFAFARNADLPGTKHGRYTEYQRQHLLATLVPVSLPVQPPFSGDLFEVLDRTAI